MDIAKSIPATRIGSIGTAVPSFSLEQAQAHGLLAQHYDDILTERARDVMSKVFAHRSIRRRYLAVSSAEELLTLKDEDPDRRMDRFTHWSVELAQRSAQQAMDRAGIRPHEVSALIVNTCTGYLCPGIATYLIERLGLRPTTMTHDLVGSGCGGALPNIHLGRRLIAHEPDGVALCISVEICTATFQMGNDISLIVSNAIFGDGAAAVLLWHRDQGARIEAERSYFDPAFRDDVRYVYRNGQLHNRITARLPQVIGDTVPGFLRDMAAARELTPGDIDHWALHPGGARMMELIQEKTGLTDRKMRTSRDVYADYGNMSSPTVLFALERLLRDGTRNGEWYAVAAYGAGLSIHGALLKA
jgi:alkylresorcinol/alkylpyrone synthase